MNLFRTFYLGLILIAFWGSAAAQDLMHVGGFGRDEIGIIGERKGFFAQEGIRVEYTHVRASIELMQGFTDGKFDVIHTTPDNVIAWAEGQGADRQTHDFIFFVGGRRGLDNRFIVGPEIKTYDDLKGKILAVDAYNTGYAPVLVYILKQHGLTLKTDYDLKVVGGGGMRREAIKRGEAVGGFSGLDDELRRRGFRVIAVANDYVPDYTRGAGAARRDWAAQNRQLLVRYIRALIRTSDFLLNPQNRDEVIQVLSADSDTSREEAEQTYQEAVGENYGFIPKLALDRKGIQLILEIREVMGEMKVPLPSPDKYIVESYYQEAIATLDSN